MNLNRKWAVFVAMSALTLGAQGVRAQDAPPPAEESATAAAPAPASRAAAKRPVSYFVEKWGKATGATVLADMATSKQLVGLPVNFESATGETLEPALTALIKRLPTGTTWAKIYLPAGRSLNADAVAEYALAQAHLFGGVGSPTPAGTIEVMGQKVSGEKADAVAAALNLRPVYIVLNQNRGASGVAAASSTDWANMTDEQKKEYAQKQAQNILAMDPKQQQQMMTQMMDQQRQIMQSLMSSMTPDQRQQFFQNMRQMMPGPGGFGGRGGGRNGGPPQN